MKSIASSNANLYFVAETLPNHSLLGLYFARNVDHRNQRAENGVFITPAHSGTGVESFEAAFLLLRYEFEYLNLHKVCTEVVARNTRAIRFNEAPGMQREGVRSQHIFADGKFRDVIQYAIFREDFQLRPSAVIRSLLAASERQTE